MASVTILSDNGATSGSAGLKTSGGNDGTMLLQTTTSGGTPTTAISISNTQVVTYTNQPTYTGGTANGVLYLNGSKAVTSGTALVFDGSNLGLGVTPSAWNSDYKSVAVSNYAEFYGRVATPSVGVSYNVYRNSGGSWIYKTTNAAARYEQDSGYHLWYTAASGTAGNAITFTQAMTLDASGNLGIGTTSPSAKLHVNNGFLQVDISGTQAVRVGSSDSILGGTDNNAVIQANTSKATIFLAGGSERARIDSSGNLLVGQTSGSYKLSVTGSVYLTSLLGTGYNSSSGATLGAFGASNDDSVNSGAVYNIEWKISGDAGGQFWRANYITRGGSRTLGAYCTGTAWTNSSDIANKENVTSTEYGLSTVMASNPVDFQWKTMRDENGVGKKDIGFIAQEMELLVPEVVSGGEGDKGISYGNLVAVAFKAIQEQQSIITQLQADVAALKGQA